MKQSIGDFLRRRLEEAGVRHIFGVPGDYNLELMQQLEDRGAPGWIGNCNELNASYATDAYARINGIAGAYSEHVPVICICGSLPLQAIQRGDLMHHTLADREKGDFCRMFAEVTAAQARLTPENAVAEIDRLILTAWRRELPVYMELPSDVSYIDIDVPERPIALEMAADAARRLRLHLRGFCLVFYRLCDIADWRYSELPNVFSRDKKADTYVVTTSNELQNVLDAPHSAMVFVECVMNKYDAPLDLIAGGHAIADTDYGPRGPQTAANAQIPLPSPISSGA